MILVSVNLAEDNLWCMITTTSGCLKVYYNFNFRALLRSIIFCTSWSQSVPLAIMRHYYLNYLQFSIILITYNSIKSYVVTLKIICCNEMLKKNLVLVFGRKIHIYTSMRAPYFFNWHRDEEWASRSRIRRRWWK